MKNSLCKYMIPKHRMTSICEWNERSVVTRKYIADIPTRMRTAVSSLHCKIRCSSCKSILDNAQNVTELRYSKLSWDVECMKQEFACQSTYEEQWSTNRKSCRWLLHFHSTNKLFKLSINITIPHDLPWYLLQKLK